jgi:hypothetical protein
MIARNLMPVAVHSLVITGTNYVNEYATAKIYKTLSGKWYADIDVVASLSLGAASATLAVQGLTFRYSHVFAAGGNGAVYTKCRCEAGTGNINCSAGGANTTWYINGTAELLNKPTFVE